MTVTWMKTWYYYCACQTCMLMCILVSGSLLVILISIVLILISSNRINTHNHIEQKKLFWTGVYKMTLMKRLCLKPGSKFNLSVSGSLFIPFAACLSFFCLDVKWRVGFIFMQCLFGSCSVFSCRYAKLIVVRVVKLLGVLDALNEIGPNKKGKRV